MLSLNPSVITVPMRLKEDTDDYRHIPDPDLPPMIIGADKVETFQNKCQKPAHIKTERFVKEYGM